jgi:tetratricopeptide (TPR) repeat protein
MPGRRKKKLLILLLLIPVGFGAYQAGWFAWGLFHANAAQTALAQRDFPQARQHLACCRRAWPSDSETLLLASQAARRDGDLDGASRLLTACREANGLPEAIALERKLLRLQSGDLTDADDFLRFCGNSPDRPEAALFLEALIVGCLEAMDLRRARRGVDLWLANHPGKHDQLQGLLWRGDIAIRSGDAENAQADYRRAVEIDPAHEGARLRLAEVLTRYSPREALDHLEQLRQRRPGDRGVQLNLARCRRALGDHQEARELLDQLLAEVQNDRAVLLERGLVELDLQDTPAAQRWLRRAEKLNPDRRDVNLALARCLRLAGKQAEAQRYQDRVAQIDAEMQRRIDRLFPQGQSPK